MVDTPHERSRIIEDPRPSALGAAADAPLASEERPLPLRCAVRALLTCGRRTAGLLAARGIRQPPTHIGRRIRFADGTDSTVYRETVIDREPPREPTVLVVCFRLRWAAHTPWLHSLFRWESELNTVLCAGFPGMVSKLWLRHDQNGVYRGFYQWDGPDLAVAYVRALWWALALVSERDSIHYAVLPGLDRDQVLADPSVIDTVAASPAGWWRPTGELTVSARAGARPTSSRSVPALPGSRWRCRPTTTGFGSDWWTDALTASARSGAHRPSPYLGGAPNRSG